MRTAICTIAKKENDYISEWCDYHLRKGFDECYIIDNNDSGYEDVRIRIPDSLKSRVHVVDAKDKPQYQVEGYLNLYKEINDKYDWVLFTDTDCFVESKVDIKEFLGRDCFKEAELIGLNVINYGDNDLLRADGRGCYERFTQRSFTVVSYNFFSRGGLQPTGYLKQGFVKSSTDYYKTLSPSGKVIERIDYSKYFEDSNEIYLKHFFSKTIGEFIDFKLNRTNVFYKGVRTVNIPDQYFFKFNKKTLEKLEILKNEFSFYEGCPIDILLVLDSNDDLDKDVIDSMERNLSDFRLILVVLPDKKNLPDFVKGNKNLFFIGYDEFLDGKNPPQATDDILLNLSKLNYFSEFIIYAENERLEEKIDTVGIVKNGIRYKSLVPVRKSEIDIAYLTKNESPLIRGEPFVEKSKV